MVFDPRWYVSLSSDNPSCVRFDLSSLHSLLPYHLHHVHGTFHLPFALGVQLLDLGDLVPLARTETPVQSTLPVQAERKRPVASAADIGGQSIVALLTRSGSEILSGSSRRTVAGSLLAQGSSALSAAPQPPSSDPPSFAEATPQALEVYESAWRRVGRVETEVGPVVIETKVSVDVLAWVGVETKASSRWFSRAGLSLVCRAQGSVVLWARVRFESEGERRRDVWGALLLGLVSLAAAVAIRWWVRGRGGRKLPGKGRW